MQGLDKVREQLQSLQNIGQSVCFGKHSVEHRTRLLDWFLIEQQGFAIGLWQCTRETEYLPSRAQQSDEMKGLLREQWDLLDLMVQYQKEIVLDFAHLKYRDMNFQ